MLMEVVIKLIWTTMMKILQTRNSRCKREVKGEKIPAKYWEYFKLIQTSRIVDGVLEYKVVCKYYQTRPVSKKVIGTTCLNCHYLKYTAKHGLVGGSKTQLWFGTLSGFDSTTLSTWIYSEEKTHEGTVNFIVGAELLLSRVNNDHFTILVKEYLQPGCFGLSANTFRNSKL